MSLNYTQLTETTRRFMMQEFDQGGHYISPRLNETGRLRWIGLLKDALQYHTDVWLERELIRRTCLTATEYLRSNTGKTITRAVNREQIAKILAEGEYNRFYLRGLCLAAQARGCSHLIVTQGRLIPTMPDAVKKVIGKAVEAPALLEILRNNSYKAIDTALGASEGANMAALSARLPLSAEAYALAQGHFNKA